MNGGEKNTRNEDMKNQHKAILMEMKATKFWRVETL